MGELVPMKYRYIGNAGLYMFCLPGSGFGPVISYAFVQSPLGWRGVYWLLLALNGVAFILWCCFYFPPSFHKKHKNDVDR
jgi:MFS family permease